MRTPVLLSILLATAVAAAAGPRVSPEAALGHRGEMVTLVGRVTGVESRADGMVLVVGNDPRVAVAVPESLRASLSSNVTEFIGRRIEVSGVLTARGPLELTLDRPEQLVAQPPAAELHALQDRVHGLEQELARLRGRMVTDAQTGIVYGPVPRIEPIPQYTVQSAVLAERGLPTRVDWGPRGRVLYYGRERWSFDAQGQLLSVQRE